MRIALIIACAAALAFSAWSNILTTADAKHALTTTTTNLPTQQFDAF